METRICPTCGCSLVRLGVTEDESVAYAHDGEGHHFCCQGCLDVFITDPQKYLRQTSDLVVCPTCLGEKQRDQAVKLEVGEREGYFCGCPYCVELFRKNPDFYTSRLRGAVPHEGVLGHEGCCVRPH